ncbi:Uma2 family endonuclease [candidate division KSB1 bacterium]|nr:Uma2 family endonuclease [candidate division KSB1 bacterium]NIS25906.1 Uma2 family endonuclease [candidate division KSB1 bacterium]NIU26594.1 Uma2 family endonuclease [candidate division KSB1 bacterium]NIU91315.1 Uma2 family endonuclease [candidate division KSB1 bacterium]NIV92819.1 Uma2 family endonuclease [candidate division KSB1 bacterium]
MTEEKFLEFCDEDIRAEFKDGEVIVHSPVSFKHVRIGAFIGSILQFYVDQHKLGTFLGDNFQVRLRPGLRRVPDLMFVCAGNKAEITDTEIEGAPDLIVEIVSSDSVERDWRDKYLEYENAGVREYWIIDPNNERFAIYCLNESGEYEAQPLEQGILQSRVLPGFWMKPEWLWQDPLPNVLNIAKELKINL